MKSSPSSVSGVVPFMLIRAPGSLNSPPSAFPTLPSVPYTLTCLGPDSSEVVVSPLPVVVSPVPVVPPPSSLHAVAAIRVAPTAATARTSLRLAIQFSSHQVDTGT